MAHATRLTNLLVQEVSAVDDPANELFGWTVMKRRQATEARLLKALNESTDPVLIIPEMAEQLSKGDADAGELVQAILEAFALLGDVEKKEVLAALTPEVKEAMRNAFHLARGTTPSRFRKAT